jgi:predicted RNase H-like HicB family nuclease
MKYRVLIEQDEDGMFVVEVPSLPGCISQGCTRHEALENIKEAIAGYLESLEAHDEPVPPPISEEVVEAISSRRRYQRGLVPVGHTCSNAPSKCS